MTDDTITISSGPRFRTAMVLAILADALQVAVFPLFVAGGLHRLLMTSSISPSEP